MANWKNKDTKISVDVVFILSESHDSGGDDVVFGLFQWNKGQIKLEKRSRFEDKATGEERWGKCMGLTLDDMHSLRTDWNEVIGIMGGNPEKDDDEVLGGDTNGRE